MRVCEVGLANGALRPIAPHLGKCSGPTEANVLQGLPRRGPARWPFSRVQSQSPKNTLHLELHVVAAHCLAEEGFSFGLGLQKGMGIPEALQSSGKTRHFLLEPFTFN